MPSKTRFDFAHNAPMTADEIRRVEILVNDEILANAASEARVMPIDEAQRSGAMMLFGEKYGDEVRVLTIGSSKELCGGTCTSAQRRHRPVQDRRRERRRRRRPPRRGGHRRRALALVQQQQALLAEAAAALKAPPAEVPAKLAQVLDNVRSLERELARLKARSSRRRRATTCWRRRSRSRARKVLAAVIEGADVNALRSTIDKLRDKLKSAAVVLASVSDGKVTLIAGVTADLTGKVKAGELVNMVARRSAARAAAVRTWRRPAARPDEAAGGAGSVQAWVEQRL
jgi:alanyl-tRNA synthetase